MLKYIGILFATLLILILWMNRGHSKIQEVTIFVIITLTVTVSATLIFSNTSELYKRDISVAYFLSNRTKEPLFFSAPVLTHYNLGHSVIYGNLVGDVNEKDKGKKIQDNGKFFSDLQVAAIMNYLFMNYHHNWLVEKITKKLPGATSTTGRSLEGDNQDLHIFKKTNLSTIFEENKFFNYIPGGFDQIALPKGTKIIYTPYSEKQRYCQIELRKPFYFNITIRVAFSSYMVGLGKIGRYTGISEDYYDKDYGTVVVNTRCEAKFNKLISGNPQMMKYKGWVNSFFEVLHEEFDWEVCDKSIKDYMETEAYHLIIENFKEAK